jgi:hypothetical protein
MRIGIGPSRISNYHCSLPGVSNRFTGEVSFPSNAAFVGIVGRASLPAFFVRFPDARPTGNRVTFGTKAQG